MLKNYQGSERQKTELKEEIAGLLVARSTCQSIEGDVSSFASLTVTNSFGNEIVRNKFDKKELRCNRKHGQMG